VMGLLAGVVAGSTWVATAAENGVATAPATMRKTIVDIEGDRFLINGVVTLKGKSYEGKSREGLLPNARMVQATFDDENEKTRGMWKYPDGSAFDAERNTREFVAAMPEWRKHGLLGITVNLQGGIAAGVFEGAAVGELGIGVGRAVEGGVYGAAGEGAGQGG